MVRKKIYHIIEWVIALAACGYLAYRLAIYDDYATLWASLRSMGVGQWSALVLCVALMPVNMSIEAWRWKTLMNGDALLNDANDGMMTWKEAHRQVYYSKLAGLITPWRLGEYPSRAILMARTMSNDQLQMTNRDLWSRVLSMGAVGSATMTASIIATGLVAMIFEIGDLRFEIAYYLFVGAVLLLLIVALVLAPRLLRRWATVSRRLILISLGQSFVRLVCWCVQLALVLYALNVFQLSTFSFQLLPVYYLLVTITPNVPIAEVGVRGAWAITLFGSMNAALAGVLLWGINTLLPCLIWPFLRKNKNNFA